MTSGQFLKPVISTGSDVSWSHWIWLNLEDLGVQEVPLSLSDWMFPFKCCEVKGKSGAFLVLHTWTLPIKTVEDFKKICWPLLGHIPTPSSLPSGLLGLSFFIPLFTQLPPFVPHWPQLSSLPVPVPTNPSLLLTLPLATPPPTRPWPPAQHESTFWWCGGAARTCDTLWDRKICAVLAVAERPEEALQPRLWVYNGPTVIRTWSRQTAGPPLLPPPISSPWEEDRTSSSHGTSRRRWMPQTGLGSTTLVRFGYIEASYQFWGWFNISIADRHGCGGWVNTLGTNYNWSYRNGT